jgi:hypothetical protein
MGDLAAVMAYGLHGHPQKKIFGERRGSRPHRELIKILKIDE